MWSKKMKTSKARITNEGGVYQVISEKRNKLPFWEKSLGESGDKKSESQSIPKK